MKLTKYIFLFPSALEKVASRFDTKVLTHHEAFVLYSIYYLPMNSTQAVLIRHAKRMNYTIAQPTISEAIHTLQRYKLVDYVDGRLSLAPLGREYLSAIRRYLINKRL